MPINMKLGLGINSGGGLRFTPKRISGLALWLDASDLATITKDGSNYVSQWNDKSGNALHVSQGVGANQPVWTDSRRNGRPGIVFSGSPQMLISTGNATITDTDPVTCYMVVKVGASLNLYGAPVAFHEPMTNKQITFAINSNGGNKFRTDTYYPSGVEGGTPVANTHYIIGWKIGNWATHRSGDTTLKVNNNNVAISAYSTINPAAITPGKIRVGAIGTTSTFYFIGDIYEIVTYRAALTVEQETRLYNYLFAKWGTP